MCIRDRLVSMCMCVLCVCVCVMQSSTQNTSVHIDTSSENTQVLKTRPCTYVHTQNTCVSCVFVCVMQALLRTFLAPHKSILFFLASRQMLHMIIIIIIFNNLSRCFSVFLFFFNDTATTEIYTILFVGSVRCV